MTMEKVIKPSRAKNRNPIARDLRTPKYRKRVETVKRAYNRKLIKKDRLDD